VAMGRCTFVAIFIIFHRSIRKRRLAIKHSLIVLNESFCGLAKASSRTLITDVLEQIILYLNQGLTSYFCTTASFLKAKEQGHSLFFPARFPTFMLSFQSGFIKA